MATITTCPDCGNSEATIEMVDGVSMVYCEKCGHYHSSEVPEAKAE
jgi:transcription elongation factor Elf1